MDLLRRGLKLSHLRLIAALKDTGQMSAAASLLSISQPAASRLSAELETILGVSLHTRHPRGITLTRYGEHIAARAQAVLRGLQDAGREISELKSGLRGSVSVGSVTGPAVELLMPVVKQVRSSHPQLTISVILDTSDNLADLFMAGGMDFYIGRIPREHDPRHYKTCMIGEEAVSLIVRADHPLISKPKMSLSDLVEFDWVMQDKQRLIRQTVEAYFIKKNIALPERVLNTSSTLLQFVAVSQSDAIAPIARSVAAFMSSASGLASNLKALNIAHDLSVSPCYLVTKAAEKLSPAASIVYDGLADSLMKMKQE